MKLQDLITCVHLLSAGIYILYFAIYYGRYSTLNQKLNGILKIEKAAVVDQSIVESSKFNTERKISKWRKRCYLPLPFIAITHFVGLYKVYPVINWNDYLFILYVSMGGFALIWLGNYTKGAQIFDPNRRFNSMDNKW